MRFVVLLLLGLGGTVAAQDAAYVDMAPQEGENVTYAYADVLRANPTYELIRTAGPMLECEGPRADAALEKPGQEVALVLASLSGELPRQECGAGNEQHEERRISGYDVEYRYKGQVYMSRMGYDPGNKLRIRITVAPVD